MSDRLATVDVGRKVGGGCCVPFRWRKLGPHLTQCSWAEPYLRSEWDPDPSSRLATIDMGHGLYASVNGESGGCCIGVSTARDAGDASSAIFGQPGTKCLIFPPKFVKIVVKLPAERCNQRLWYKQDTETVRERVIVLVLHEL